MWIGEEVQGAVAWRFPDRQKVGQEAHMMATLVTGGWEGAAEECEKLGFLQTAEYFRKMVAERAFTPESVLWP